MNFLTALILITASLLAFNNCGQGLSTVSTNSSTQSICPQADAAIRNPTTISETMTLINALPKPLSLNCFVENLARPQKVFSMHSPGSAQKTDSADSPRIFIFSGNLILSVAASGTAKEMLEMSEIINSNETVKGEVLFPVQGPLSPAEPFNRILASSGTNCKFCHGGERPVTGFAGQAYASTFSRPSPFTLVSASHLRQLALNCNPSVDAHRCGILKAVFVTGQAQDQFFP